MLPPNLIGELAMRGDWACIHGELAILGDLVRTISESVPEPLHCTLVAFAELCAADPARASDEWPRVRERLFQVRL